MNQDSYVCVLRVVWTNPSNLVWTLCSAYIIFDGDHIELRVLKRTPSVRTQVYY